MHDKEKTGILGTTKQEAEQAIQPALRADEIRKEVTRDLEEKIANQIEHDKATYITVLGLFASVISFLTIEFQLLKTVCCVQKIIGFSLIIFVLLLSFNIGLDYLVKSRLNKNVDKPNIFYCGTLIIVFILGVLFSFCGNEDVYRENNIYQKYSESFDNKFQEFQKKYKAEIDHLHSELITLKQLIEQNNKSTNAST